MSLKIGVIGVGQRAQIATLAAANGAEVVAAADPSEGGRAYARELFGDDARLYEDNRQLVEDGSVDAVMVFTPDHLHTGPVLDALRAGLAVFVEKPLAISIEDCDEILATARETGSRLYVGHNMRHAPVVREMKRLVDEGAIGRVQTIWCRHFVGHGGDYYFKDWHADRRRTLSLMLQKAAHDLDVIHLLAGSPTRQVVAMGDLRVYGDPSRRRTVEAAPGNRMGDWFNPDRWPPTTLDELNPVVDVEDLSMMLGRLANNVLISYEQCHFTPDYWRNYTVIGDEGRLENFGDGFDGEDPVVRVWNTRRSGYRSHGDLEVEIARADGSHGGADEHLVAEFVRFAAEGGPTETSPVFAREAVAAGVAATHSLREGSRTVDIPDLPPDLVAYFDRGQVEGKPGLS